MWDLVPGPGIEPGAPVLGAWSLSLWTTMEVQFMSSLYILNTYPLLDVCATDIFS